MGTTGIIGFAAVGLCVLYVALCLMFNTSAVTVGNGEIQARSGPLPTHWRNQVMASERVFAVLIDRAASDLRPSWRNPLSYHLKLEVDGLEHIRWAGGIRNVTSAFHIHDALELLLTMHQGTAPSE